MCVCLVLKHFWNNIIIYEIIIRKHVKQVSFNILCFLIPILLFFLFLFRGKIINFLANVMCIFLFLYSLLTSSCYSLPLPATANNKHINSVNTFLCMNFLFYHSSGACSFYYFQFLIHKNIINENISLRKLTKQWDSVNVLR